MELQVVSLDDWIGLEDALAVRYPKAKWRGQAVLKGLLRFPYWKVPTCEESWEQTSGCSRPALHRRRLEAAAELDLMATLPPLTTGLELALRQQQRAFGLKVDIVRPEDRHLSVYHVWALCDRRRTAELVCQVFGAKWIVPLSILEQELQRRQDQEAVQVIKLHAERRRASSPDRGPQVVGFTF